MPEDIPVQYENAIKGKKMCNAGGKGKYTDIKFISESPSDCPFQSLISNIEVRLIYQAGSSGVNANLQTSALSRQRFSI